MNFKSFNKINNAVGWLVFAIGAFTFLSTMEPTVSLWDNGEFIPSDYKLEVSHPPGAPFYVLVYHMFALVGHAIGGVKMVPIFTNAASALCCAFTVMFLFWTITALAIKFLSNDEENMENGNIYAVIGAGIVGALAFCWSDTFWFSAVESIVWTPAIFFISLISWLLLKWERRANEPYNLRWLILIFFLVGLVMGVHFLGLLTIPSVIFGYYLKRFKFSWLGAMIAAVVGVVVLGFVHLGIKEWIPGIAGYFELLFVNDFGMPFFSGVYVFIGIIAALAIFGLYYTHRRQMVLLNTAILCFISIEIGFLSYSEVIIRAIADPPVNMYKVDNIFTLVGYVGREQYGESYVLNGPYYNANMTRKVSTEAGAPIYHRDDKTHTYVSDEHQVVFNYEYTTFFPRMFNAQDNYLQGYRYWGNIKQVPAPDGSGKTIWEDEDPNFQFSFVKNNLRFFWNYQVIYMYLRYFGWNFIGRQNDFQGMENEFNHGRCLSGIPWVDEHVLHDGPQKDLPIYMKANRALNKLYGFPLILGLIGLFYHYKRDRNQFLNLLLLFLMTGLALEIYLNMASPQPRERDYPIIGSFYVFSIWIGMGVLAIWEWGKKRMASPTSAFVATGLCTVLVPVIMVSQEWDDHDRSRRTCALDYGVNYLQSCPPNAVLFTNGDNDTYPLWYAQEVEGIRADVRIINLSLLSTDWYINELRKPRINDNHSPGLTLSINQNETRGWEYIQFYDNPQRKFDQSLFYPLTKVMHFIADSSMRLPTTEGDRIPYLPVKKLRIDVDKKAAIASGTVAAKDSASIVDHIDFDLNRNNLMKSDVVVLDFIATNNWKYPVCFSVTSGPNEYLNLGQYLEQDGLVYRLTPVKNTTPTARGEIRLAGDTMYNNIMHKFGWGHLQDRTVLVDAVMARESNNLRGIMLRLAAQFQQEGDNVKAIKLIDTCLYVIPERNVPYDYYIVPMVQVYFRAGATQKGHDLGMKMADILAHDLLYYSKLKPDMMQETQDEIQRDMYGLKSLLDIAKEKNQKDLTDKLEPLFNQYASQGSPFSFLFQQQGQQ